MTELDTASRRPGTTAAPAQRRRGARRWWLAVMALAAAIAVAADVSTHVTPAYHRAQLRSYLSAAAGDTAACQAGLRDAVRAFTAWRSGSQAVSRATAATFTRQAIAACGFASDSITALAGDQPSRPIASPLVDRVAPVLGTWAYLDAFTFLQDLAVLIAHPASATARSRAQDALTALAAQRSRVETLAAKVERAGHLPARPVSVIAVTALLPHGSLPGAHSAPAAQPSTPRVSG